MDFVHAQIVCQRVYVFAINVEDPFDCIQAGLRGQSELIPPSLPREGLKATALRRYQTALHGGETWHEGHPTLR